MLKTVGMKFTIKDLMEEIEMGKKLVESAGVKPPKGMTIQNSGDFAPVHEFKKKGEIFEGVVKSVKDVEKGGNIRKATRTCEVITKDGIFSLWEKTALKGMFDQATKKKNLKIWIHFKGMKKVKGRKQPMYDLEVAY
jgi:uncharacterized protein YdeI (YjbR/CyaY-like superfamily)